MKKTRARDLDSPFYMERTLFDADMAEYRHNRETVYMRSPNVFKHDKVKR